MPAIDEDIEPAVLAQENLRLRGDLLTVASRINHDLRTPLGSITTTCEILKEVMIDETATDTSLISPILTSTDEVVRLLERVSFVLKASVQPEPKQPVFIGETAAAALQRLESRILARRAVVTQPATWPEVFAVTRWLETIWWNFVANALQHGGEAPHIHLDWRKADGAYRFWVDDNGGGVPPQTRPRLFQPFHTLHQTNSARGLGLSIVQRLVELQGGTCGYEPPPEGGARFYFTLPEESNPKSS